MESDRRIFIKQAALEVEVLSFRLISCKNQQGGAEGIKIKRGRVQLFNMSSDAVHLSSISPLSGWSESNHSNPIEIPDFTYVAYKNNAPAISTMEGVGTTNIRNLSSVNALNS